ncbi:MAG TPA: FAD/NAD(P)-binding protein, partial [Cellulomonas sp.]
MREVAVVGGGPRGVAVLERVVAHARSRPPGVRLRLHLVEPHEPGPGSVWRVDQPAELVMNTDGSHVTLFPDPSVEVLGPTVPGPTLQEWCRLALALLADSPRADVDPEVARVFAEGPAPTRTELDPVRDRLTAVLDGAFPSRAVYGLYLRWFFGRARALLPDGVEMVVHRTRAVACAPAAGGRYRLDLADGTRLVVDAAVLATGWLAARRETRAGLRHLPPGNPLDQGLETVPPGTHLAVRGFGMNFFDAMVLLTVCRGGRFVPSGPDGSLSYRPSGAEPVLHVGSRRGVPFRGKAEGRLP